MRVGIVGVGRVTLERHIPGIRAAGGEVVALADIAPGRAAKYATQLGIPLAFDDYRRLLSRPEIEVVSVATPPIAHEEVAVAALEAGKHVYLDKPPTMNEAQMVHIAETAQRMGKRLMSGSNSIYYHEIQALKRRIVAGELGEIYYVECLRLSRRRLLSGWIRQKRMGGGIGMDSCVHRLDQSLYLLGTPGVRAVTARTYNKYAAHPYRDAYLPMDVAEGTQRDPPVADVEDTLVAFIQFDTGCTLLLRDAYAANIPDERFSNLYGTKAGVVLRPQTSSPDSPPLMVYGEDADGSLTNTKLVLPPPPGTEFEQAFRHFFACIREGRETESPGARSIILMRIIDAIYESAAHEGRQVVFS